MKIAPVLFTTLLLLMWESPRLLRPPPDSFSASSDLHPHAGVHTVLTNIACIAATSSGPVPMFRSGDQPDWLRRRDPWSFYEEDEILKRQARWR